MNKIGEELEEEEEEEEEEEGRGGGRGREEEKIYHNSEQIKNEGKIDEATMQENTENEAEKGGGGGGGSSSSEDQQHKQNHNKEIAEEPEIEESAIKNNTENVPGTRENEAFQGELQQQTVLAKDPMRDSLMSNSGDEDDDDDDLAISKENNDNNLDLEFDLWEGQFQISKPKYSPTYGYFKDIVKTVQMLQQQVGVLAENQSNTDDRYSRVRQDNAAYQERVVMLEEQLREAEHRHEERRTEEERRNRELLARVEREKQLTVENYAIKLASLEKDKTAQDEETKRTKSLLEKLQREKEALEDKISEAEFTASALQQENTKLEERGRRREEEAKVERERSGQVIEELRCEIERLRVCEEEASRRRAPSVDASSSPPPEVQATLKRLREENKGLVEQVEDLQAQLLTSHLEEGRTLVTATNNNSLAAEFEAMTNEEGAQYGSETIEKLRKSLKDSQEANQHLRAYIDGILLNIVENYPQLLEVKQPK